VAGLELGGGHRLVDPQLTPRKTREELPHPLDPRGRVRILAHQERVHGERAGVDHRILRPARVLFERELVERLTGGLHAHGGEHRLGAAVHERGGIGEGLGDRLDGERDVGVTRGVGATERRGQ